jgi:hypothetical protein
MSLRNETMTKDIMPKTSTSSSQTTPPFTTANLAAHQRAMAASSSTTTSQGGWVCGGEMYHRPATPNQNRWNKLVKKDPLATDIDTILRASTSAKQDQGN